MCTLQIIVFADGISRCKPLMMFKGVEKKRDSHCYTEYKEYHPRVIVIFNKKAYANTLNLINQVKNQYSTTSTYPLCNNKP